MNSVSKSILICPVAFFIVSMWQGGEVFRCQKVIDSEKVAQISIVAKKIATPRWSHIMSMKRN